MFIISSHFINKRNSEVDFLYLRLDNGANGRVIPRKQQVHSKVPVDDILSKKNVFWFHFFLPDKDILSPLGEW